MYVVGVNWRMIVKLYIIGAIAALALLTHSAAPAQIIQNHNSSAPVTFDAGRIELQDRSDRVLFTGGVTVTQAGLTLKANRLTAAYENEQSIDVNRLDAIGDVTITKADLRTKSNAAIYDLDNNLITLIGNVSVTQGTNIINGGRIVIDLTQNRTSVEAQPQSNGQSGRVTGKFSVPQRKKDDSADNPN